MENEKRIIELLERIDASSRKQTWYARFQFIMSVTVAVFCILLIMTCMRILPQLQDMLVQAETVLGNLEDVSTELVNSDLPGMVENIDVLVGNVDDLVSTSQDGVQQAIGKINAIDFEKLNTAIKDLSDVIEPIAKFFKSFKFG